MMKVLFVDSMEGGVDYSHSIPSKKGESQNPASNAFMSRAKRKISTVHCQGRSYHIFLKLNERIARLMEEA